MRAKANVRGWRWLLLPLFVSASVGMGACRSASSTPAEPTAAERAEGLYLQGTSRYLKGDFEGALKDFEEVRRLRPDDARLPAALGEVYLSQGRAPEAIAAFEEATRREPGRATSWSRLGQALRMGGRGQEAQAALEQAAALNPKDGFALEYLGDVAAAAGEADTAVERYTRAAEGSAGEEQARRYLKGAEVFSAHGRLKEATEHLDAAAKKGVESRLLFTELGDLHVKQGALDLAAEAYRRGAKLGGGDASLWETVGEIELTQGRLPQAEQAFRESLRIQPRAFAHIALARLHLRRGETDQAEGQLLQALERATGEDPRESRELAELLVALGRKPDAVKLLSALAEEQDFETDLPLQRRLLELARELGDLNTERSVCARVPAECAAASGKRRLRQ